MELRPLGKTGLQLSSLGFGASSLGGVFRPVNEADGIRAVHLAFDHGVNYVDVSPYYGLTKAETVLGRALKTIPRDRYFISTKAGRYGSRAEEFDFSPRRITASIDESLARLGLDHVDILLAHDIEFGDVGRIIHETIPALRRLQKAGKTRFIGISGLPLGCLGRVADACSVDVILSYCHYQLNDDALKEYIPRWTEQGIGIISAAPLGMGLLSDRKPPDWHPAPPQLREAAARAAAHCQSRGRSIEELALQYAVAHPAIASTVVGTADPGEMRRNLRAIQSPPDPQLLAEVIDILRPVQNLTWLSGRPENN